MLCRPDLLGRVVALLMVTGIVGVNASPSSGASYRGAVVTMTEFGRTSIAKAIGVGDLTPNIEKVRALIPLFWDGKAFGAPSHHASGWHHMVAFFCSTIGKISPQRIVTEPLDCNEPTYIACGKAPCITYSDAGVGEFADFALFDAEWLNAQIGALKDPGVLELQIAEAGKGDGGYSKSAGQSSEPERIARERLLGLFLFLGGMFGAVIHLCGWVLIALGYRRCGFFALVGGAYTVVWGPLSLTYDWWPLGNLWRGLL